MAYGLMLRLLMKHVFSYATLNKFRPLVRSVCFLLAFSVSASLVAAGEDDWFLDNLEEKINKVNEGNLVFIDQPPNKQVHYHQNHVTLKPSSLKDGWVGLTQCHQNLDPVARVEIVFREGFVRRLKIQSMQQIGKAWVQGSSVQLKDVSKNAQLCVEAESNSLIKLSNGSYRLLHGPFMRKFLDGYYPMHVSMDVQLPKQLRFVSILPSNQQGFKVWQSSNSVHFDTWFEGKLLTEFIFESTL